MSLHDLVARLAGPANPCTSGGTWSLVFFAPQGWVPGVFLAERVLIRIFRGGDFYFGGTVGVPSLGRERRGSSKPFAQDR